MRTLETEPVLVASIDTGEIPTMKPRLSRFDFWASLTATLLAITVIPTAILSFYYIVLGG